MGVVVGVPACHRQTMSENRESEMATKHLAFPKPPPKWVSVHRGVMIPAQDPDPESDFQLFGDSGSGIVTPLVCNVG